MWNKVDKQIMLASVIAFKKTTSFKFKTFSLNSNFLNKATSQVQSFQWKNNKKLRYNKVNFQKNIKLPYDDATVNCDFKNLKFHLHETYII